MNVLIVEDEYLSAERLRKMIEDIDASIHVLAVIPSVFDTIAYLQNKSNTSPDLIFLDIHLEDDNGFRIVESLNLTIPVIFTTAFDEYALKAFKTNSIDYLLKPISPLELQASLIKFKRLNATPPPVSAANTADAPVPEKYKDRFLCTAGSRIFTFTSPEIAYFVIEEKATFLRLFDGRHFAVEYSLDKLSQLMDPVRFFRINRSLMVSINAIRNIHTISAGKLKIDLDPALAQEAYVSPDRVSAFKNWLGK
ncbi:MULTISPECIES: LytR/AlgR family response regulator transcription factor [Dyadobacter]|uniref:Response regulator transcription factor n=2 Tax=Dyadobacter TaxID=120831 RepID=A0A5R9KMJ0_9BACT|nr:MULTISPECIES: LytTR family DNA-binding domain-containing protein [Dyadobacter]KAA6439756.1 response regulator transcription factor [Dyadobacter flavalbus]TLU97440.1 response regulator transcription factor [Dyadobacter sediminis]GGC15100.1 DNA-binding response regulator [Dyadobacter sediminis]